MKIKKKKPTSQRQKIKKPINWKKVGVVFLAICFLLLVIWVLLFSSALKIKNIKVDGLDNQKRVISEVSKAKQSFLFNKLPRDNLILFPRTQLIKDITSDSIEIKKVEVVKEFPDTLIIKIIKREKLFLWRFPSGCQLYDKDGTKIKSIDCASDEGNKLTAICQDDDLTKGLECLSIKSDDDISNFDTNIIKEKSQLVEKIFNFLKQTTYFNSSILMTVPSIVTGEINVKNTQYGNLLFDNSNDIDRQFKTLKAFLEQKISLNELKQIDYIDLRIKNKLIYKFKENSEFNEDKSEEQKNE